MENRQGIAEKALGALKTAVFEKGRLIYWANIPSFRRSRKRIEAKPRKEKIRIGFMVQCPQNWAVIQSVYEHALQDEQLEPVVMLVPEMEYAYYIQVKNIRWERTYAFGEEKFGDSAIRTYNPDTGEWLDPETLDLDYVFIPRPYETYLPKAYRASSFRRFAKVCYVPYAFPIFCDWEVAYNTHFIRNVSMIFCEKKKSAEYVQNKLSLTIRGKDQKAFLCGYPKFDLIEGYAGQESDRWPRKREESVARLIWTPRWTTDPKLGGSNFFKYKDRMIEWAERDKTIDLVFRPHPLALEHYITAGLMTKQEQDEYLDRYNRCENANVDRATAYFDTFYSSDFLITDVSSIIMDYLFTEKPIIYCTASGDEPFSIPELRECLYVVDSFEEMTGIVEQVRRGNDPKAELRSRLIRTLKPGKTAASRILQEIRSDYYGT